VYPEWTEQRQTVFVDRYALKDESGNALEHSPDEMFWRVAHAVGDDDNEYQAFYKIMREWKFLPGGRILAGAGSGHEVTYFNCFVIPTRPKDLSYGCDSRASIMDTIATMLEISSRGGGVGINWSVLRPKGAYVKGVGGTSSGAVSWMLAADGVAAQVEQGGTRRAALMFLLWDWHPDIEEFVDVKKDRTKMQHANLSVAVSDAFTEAVKNGSIWRLEFPDTSHPEYDAVWDGNLARWKARGLPTVVYKEVPARELWKKICQSAWECGEPGVVFLERYNKEYAVSYVSEILATNPCGELGLEPYGVCCLGSLNLVAFFDPKTGDMDWEELRHTIRLAVRFLDRVIDINPYFLPENEAQARKFRRIGLGTMGLADLLVLKGIRYGSEDAVNFVKHLYKFIAQEAYRASIVLAIQDGPFPAFDAAQYSVSNFVARLGTNLYDDIVKYGIRNATLLAQAPTGTTSILAGVSSGIEPNFAKEYVRHDHVGEFTVRHWLADYPAFVSAHEITPEEHVRMQAAVQYYTDSSVSKTVNAPKTATLEQVENLFMAAYDLGCKGITYYRDGSREGVLTAASQERKKAGRPAVLSGFTRRVETPAGRAYITINMLDNKPFELFANLGRAGSDISAFTEALARLISLALRSGVNPEDVARQLIGIGGATSVGFGNGKVLSVPDAIGKVLRDAVSDASAVELLDVCPSCGVIALANKEGCQSCQNCGYSKC